MGFTAKRTRRRSRAVARMVLAYRGMNYLTAVSFAGALLAAVVLTPATAGAQTAVDKLGRGIAGMVGGVLELPGQMITESERRGPEGLPLGFAKGLGMIVAREVTGVYEFVTAPIPVPRGYRPLLEPEYPWDHFRRL